jgi:hypothetical protein
MMRAKSLMVRQPESPVRPSRYQEQVTVPERKALRP